MVVCTGEDPPVPIAAISRRLNLLHHCLAHHTLHTFRPSVSPSPQPQRPNTAHPRPRFQHRRCRAGTQERSPKPSGPRSHIHACVHPCMQVQYYPRDILIYPQCNISPSTLAHCLSPSQGGAHPEPGLALRRSTRTGSVPAYRRIPSQTNTGLAVALAPPSDPRDP